MHPVTLSKYLNCVNFRNCSAAYSVQATEKVNTLKKQSQPLIITVSRQVNDSIPSSEETTKMMDQFHWLLFKSRANMQGIEPSSSC